MAALYYLVVPEIVPGNLSSVELQEIGRLWRLKDKLNSLKSTLRTIKIGVQDAEVKQRKSEVIHAGVRKLKDDTYDAEDILREAEGLKRRMISGSGILSSRNPLSFRLKMVREVKKIRGKLDAIAKERHKLHIKWLEFEVQHGNEDTFREMLRVKRSVSASYSQTHFILPEYLMHKDQMQTLDEAKDVLKKAGVDDDEMAALERQLVPTANDATVKDAGRRLGFVSAGLQQNGEKATANREDIELPEDSESEDA